MEEILASIRRIIAEDEKPPGGPEAAAAEAEAPEFDRSEDVLDLTEIVEDEPTGPLAAEIATARAPAEAAPPGLANIETGQPEIKEKPTMPSAKDRLVSDAAASASSAAFSSVSDQVRKRTPPDIEFGNGVVTLEDMVRDLVRPMLKEWLDGHLPPMVERIVREEVERLAREI